MLLPMTSLPRPGLTRVLEEFGTTLLDVVAGEITTEEIGGLVFYDPYDELQLPGQALVMGVGLHEPDDIAHVLLRIGALGAIALVVRAPVLDDESLQEAARSSGVALLSLTPGAPWTHLAAMLRTLVVGPERDDAQADDATFGRMRSGDLFAVANAIAALLNAPVTIEDRNSRLLAFSSRQDDVDQSRIETILGRQVPVQYTDILKEQGVFQEIYRSQRPLYVSPLPEAVAPGRLELGRAAIAVRAGEEILGTIWVVVPEPLDEERAQALYDASKLVAMHMVWQRADADGERRMRSELLSAALDSGPGSRDAGQRLGLRDEPSVVLALTLIGTETDLPLPAHVASERQRMADAFALHLSAIHPRSTSALVGDIAYGIVPLPLQGEDAEARAVWIAHEFLGRVGSRFRSLADQEAELRPIIGVGPMAQDRSDLARSRSGADRALRVLRSAKSAGRQVALLDDVHMEALLLEIADTVPRSEMPSGALARLLAYDAAHRSSLVETLSAWLDAFGDVALASAATFVHGNTFRYRLRRAAEVGRVDLTDPEARLAIMLQLRLLSLRSSSID